MHLIFTYLDKELGKALAESFGDLPNCEVVESDICKVQCDAIVSPANSFGFMDGGLDLRLSERFGWGVQERLQALIASRPMRELLVGEYIVIETNDNQVPWLISVPTMRVPMRLRQTVNPYLAMKALLVAALNHKGTPEITTVAIPGLGTGCGHLDPTTATKQMRKAFDEIHEEQFVFPVHFNEAQRRHIDLNPSEINIWDP